MFKAFASSLSASHGNCGSGWKQYCFAVDTLGRKPIFNGAGSGFSAPLDIFRVGTTLFSHYWRNRYWRLRQLADFVVLNGIVASAQIIPTLAFFVFWPPVLNVKNCSNKLTVSTFSGAANIYTIFWEHNASSYSSPCTSWGRSLARLGKHPRPGNTRLFRTARFVYV